MFPGNSDLSVLYRLFSTGFMIQEDAARRPPGSDPDRQLGRGPPSSRDQGSRTNGVAGYAGPAPSSESSATLAGSSSASSRISSRTASATASSTASVTSSSMIASSTA